MNTNEVETPFGAIYTNLYARVPEFSEFAPRSAFFMLAGQCDAVERSLGYDPADPDMDGDGVPDGRELSLGANPFATDSDDDGLSDGQEIALGTDPCDADTDGDAMSDGWEVLYGFDPRPTRKNPAPRRGAGFLRVGSFQAASNQPPAASLADALYALHCPATPCIVAVATLLPSINTNSRDSFRKLSTFGAP